MIVRECSLLFLVISKLESLIADEKSQHPNLSDEEIIEKLKYKIATQNKSN
jgi:hypothetical protein